MNLATLLILTMTAELEQASKMSGQLVPASDDVRAAYNRLLKLDMGSTQNAKALRRMVDESDKQWMDIQIAKHLIDFVKVVRRILGPRTVLISNKAFSDLCKKYNLSIGLLREYTGVIPERNVQDIENAVNGIKELGCYYKLLNKKDFLEKSYLLKISSVKYAGGDEGLVGFINNRNHIISVKRNVANYDGTWWASDIIGAIKGVHYEFNCLTKISGSILGPETMLIACPKQYLKNPDIEVSKRPIDPAVFQYTPFGVLVHTIWGEEAEDEALAKFMDINLRITNS